jgi:P pilus assembly chaperone PapD
MVSKKLILLITVLLVVLCSVLWANKTESQIGLPTQKVVFNLNDYATSTEVSDLPYKYNLIESVLDESESQEEKKEKLSNFIGGIK